MSVGGPIQRGWSSSARLLALAISAAAIVLTACGALLYYAATSVDRLTEARETRLMERAIARRLVRIEEDIASVAVWTDAYERTARTYDAEWAHINYGDYFYEYLHHEASFVLAGNDRPLYASIRGEAQDPSELALLITASRGLVAQVRKDAAAKVARNPRALGFDRVAKRQAGVRVGDKVYLVGASTVAPEPEYVGPLPASPEPVIVSAIALDDAFLGDLREDFGLKDARLALSGARLAVPVAGPEGAPIAALTWSPERPGLGVYREAFLPIVLVGLAVVTAVSLVIFQAWRSARQVVQARDRAEAGERAKAEFIANISHEIRTPLNGVLGMVQVMERDELSREQRSRLTVVRESGAMLLALLNEVLDFSKMEAGRLEVVNGPFSIEDLVERVAATFRVLASSKGLEFELRIGSEIEGRWIGDALRIRQVLTNLTANAVKFTEAGKVVLSVAKEEQDVVFSVSDTGIGFDEAEVPDLFGKFAQGDASTTRRFGGTGLGLSISRGLADLMSGTLTAHGQRGKGATFELRLPLMREPVDGSPLAVTLTAPTAASLPTPPRVLAAEDNPANQLVLTALLESAGATLTLVGDGAAAVEACRGATFDVILMDIQMPRMNGIDATKAIRALEVERGDGPTPILALTANVMTSQIESYLAAGMDGYVAKPIDVAALFDAIELAIAGERAAVAA